MLYLISWWRKYLISMARAYTKCCVANLQIVALTPMQMVFTIMMTITLPMQVPVLLRPSLSMPFFLRLGHNMARIET